MLLLSCEDSQIEAHKIVKDKWGIAQSRTLLEFWNLNQGLDVQKAVYYPGWFWKEKAVFMLPALIQRRQVVRKKLLQKLTRFKQLIQVPDWLITAAGG